MKILIIADRELPELWDMWESAGRKRLAGVELILSAGDLKAEYLEFLVTMLNVPCLYVRGNHDADYNRRPPEGCIDADGTVTELTFPQPDGAPPLTIRVAGLGGSVSSPGDPSSGRAGSGVCTRDPFDVFMGTKKRRILPCTCTEKEMAGRARRLRRPFQKKKARCVRILLTHAPCLGYGDLDDPAHRGFSCFHEFLVSTRPDYHCFGHVHMEYGRISRILRHPSGTTLINGSGMYLLEI